MGDALEEEEADAEASEQDTIAEAVRAAVRAELDEVLPHIVTSLKRHDAVADLSRRLDAAERRLAERDQRPLVAGLRRTLITARGLEFDAEAKELIVAELERLLVGAGYTEFGEVGEPFDPARHEAITGEAPSDRAVVAEVFEPGIETLGTVLAPARVRVGQSEPEVPAP